MVLANVGSVVGWRGGAMVGPMSMGRASDLRSRGREFDPRPGAAA